MGGDCQKIAAVVWSAVRVVLLSDPIAFTSSKSFVYPVLVSAFGPLERNCEGLSITNGFRFPTQASGSVAVAVSGRHRPASARRSNVNGARYPSVARAASIAAAAAAPTRMPSSFVAPDGIGSSVFPYAASSSATRAGSTIATSTLCAAVAIAASCEPNGCAFSFARSSRYGLYAGAIAFTASYTAPCTIAMPRVWPCAVGRIAIAWFWAMTFQSFRTSACATAGAASETARLARTSPRRM